MKPIIFHSGIFQEFSRVVSRLANNPDSLLRNVDNNICEHFYIIINNYLSGKRINYSQMQAYHVWVDAAVYAHNTAGKCIRVIHMNMVNEF